MKIGRIEAFAVRYPESNNNGKIRALTLVRIETTTGKRAGAKRSLGERTRPLRSSSSWNAGWPLSCSTTTHSAWSDYGTGNVTGTA